MTSLEKAAIAWWKMHRPLTFTIDEHIMNPSINCITPSEKRLGGECGRLTALNRRSTRNNQPVKHPKHHE